MAVKGILGIVVLGLLLLISPCLYSEDAGFKYLKNYSYGEYDHQPQNWGIVQARNGVIYVANQGGVLEFDGVSWRVYYDPPSRVRSIAIDETGTIYIGGVDNIGYLAPDEKGSLRYISLLDHLDDKYKNFSGVWSTHATKEGIYFRTSNFLFRWDSRRIKTWKTDNPIRGSYSCKGELFIYQKNVGLMKMVDDSLELIPGGKEFANEKKIFIIVPYDSRRLLIGTRPSGFFVYDGMKIVPYPTEADEYLNKKKAYNGIRLSSGDFALATLSGGLVIIDPWGHLKHIFDKTYGLQDDRVYYVFEDIQGNLWLCLDKGITKIEYASSISLYDDRSGLSGSVSSVVRYHNNLYVGTTNGLYYLESPFKFCLIPGISGGCWGLLSIHDSLLAATTGGTFHIKKNSKRRVIEHTSYVLLSSKHHPGRVWCGTKGGLVALIEKNGQWIEEHRFEKVDQDIRFIAEDQTGNLWLVTSTGGVIKVDFRPDINHPVVAWYDSSHGFPDGGIDSIGVAAGHVIFATKKGLFRFNEKEKKFIPDETLGKEFAGGRPDSKPVFRIFEDKNKNIWFHSQSRNYQAIPQTDGSFKIYSEPFRRIPTTNQVNTIYPDPDGETIWFAGNDGLFRYDKTVKKNYQVDFSTLIRKVIVNGNLTFDGYKCKTDSDSARLIPTIDYKDRKNFQFEFAATFFEAETATEYSYLLGGHDNHWSDWKSESNKEFTILDSGMYRFRVQARNVYGRLGREAVFQFKILPPWYKTWWAFLLYTILFFLLVFFIVRWRSGKLEREKQRLEQIVKERTKEINDKNQQLEKQTIQLKEQSEKLKEMDQVKSRFFANISHEFRTPLTLIMSPLEQMLDNTRDEKEKKELNMMLRNSRRLLTLINQLLDLSRIDSGKMKLQTACQNIVPFLKGIVASFHMLAEKNGLELEFHDEEEEIFLSFDAQKIEEAMYNLLINAIKFTPPGGKITVSVSIDRQDQPGEGNLPPGFVKISVCDTGIGIPKDQLSQIFDRFFQAKISKEKTHKGTGIGLALTKEIVLLHRGKIDVHSQLGKGTEFVILLPLEPKQPEPGEIAATSETPANLKKRKEVEMRYKIEEEDEPAAVKTGTEPGIKAGGQGKNIILVVEDNADVRNYIRGPLEQFYTVVEAGDGKEGIDKAKEIIPDLIVSDIMMPEKDGYELCRELKKDVRTSHIPTILLTAKASEESIIQGLETGADDYVTKPFNTKILLSRIKNLIDLRRQLQLKIQRQKMLLPHEISVSSVDEKFLKELQDIIEKNLSDEDFNADMLCEKLHMGRSTLFRKIQALAGETPGQFIHSYRLERAAKLLRENFGNVTEVAMEVGFSSPQYFAKLFKEKFHRSPSSFKASEAKSS